MKKIIFVLLSTILISALVIYFFFNKAQNSQKGGDSFDGKSSLQSNMTTSSAGGGIISPTSPSSDNRCKGLSGELEVQVLVGPAEAVGMPPVAVGRIPFSIISAKTPYLVQGGGPISYQETLSQAWGTYSVNLDMEATIEGECLGEPGNETLDMTGIFTGNQMVEVRASGFQGDYPWEGTQTLELNFPLQEGTTSEGEGWVVVLHLDNKD